MIFKDIAQYEEGDSALAKHTIMELQERIDKAIEYLNNLPTGELEENVYNLSVILGGEDKE